MLRLLTSLILAALALPALAGGEITTERFYIDSPEAGLKLYLLNKHPAAMKRATPGKVILFVHGATYPSEAAFDVDLPGGSWMDYVAARGYDVYLVDVRGYGGSSRPPAMDRPPAEGQPFADTADAVRDVGAAVDFILARRKINSLDLLGWSWGTAIMAGYSAQNPEKVSKLVLYAPIWIIKEDAPVSGSGAYRTLAKDAAKTRALRGVPAEKIAEVSPEGWSDIWWAAAQASDPGGASAASPVMRAPNGVVKDLSERWAKGEPTYDPAKIKAPTLLILGEWDREAPLYMSEDLFGKLVNAHQRRLVVLPEGNHFLLWEKNRLALISQVQAFLDEGR